MNEDLNYYMQKIKEGDKDSFRFLATSLGNKMFATASKLMGSNYEHEAEDAVQIALIKLWQTAPRWKSKGSVEGLFAGSFFLPAWICIVDISLV